MKIYRGVRRGDACDVTVDGAPLRPADGFPGDAAGGFEWGYDGAGPSRLAYALVADHFGDVARALTHHRTLLANFVARIETDSWSLDTRRIDDILANPTVEIPLTLAELLKKARSS